MQTYRGAITHRDACMSEIVQTYISCAETHVCMSEIVQSYMDGTTHACRLMPADGPCLVRCPPICLTPNKTRTGMPVDKLCSIGSSNHCTVHRAGCSLQIKTNHDGYEICWRGPVNGHYQLRRNRRE